MIAPRSAQTQLGFDADGLWAVEEMLMARHHMHRQVYGHKTRVATDIMITRALKLAVESDVLPERGYRVDLDEDGKVNVTDDFLELYLAQTDVLVLDVLRSAPEGSPVADLAERLAFRRILRRSVSIRLDERTDDLGDAKYALIRDPEEFTPARIKQIEERVAEALRLPPHLVAIYLDSRANPTYRNPGAPPGRKDIMVQRDGAQPRLLHRESEIFRDEMGPDHTWIYLYTPRLKDDNEECQAADKSAEELLWTELQNL